MKNRSKFKNHPRLKIMILFAILFGIAACKKNSTRDIDLNSPPKGVLSENAPDLAARLAAIKEKFYANGLAKKLIPNVDQRLNWIPDWNAPKIQVVNDSVSYVFFKLIAQIKKDGQLLEATEKGASSYLMIKNEKEFYRAIYLPPSPSDKDAKMAIPEKINLKSFSGRLLLLSLQYENNYLIRYNEGKLSPAYLQLSAKTKALQATKNSTSFWQQQCHTELRACTFVSDGFSSCGGGIDVIYNEYCNWPPSICGVTYYLTDSDERTICEDVWFPDPPTDPIDTGGGDGGETPTDITSQFKDYPCAKDLVDKMKTLNSDIANLIKSTFAKNDNVNIKFIAEPSLSGTTTDGKLIQQTAAGPTTSYTIGINPDVLTTSTKEYILVTLYHEALHAYFAQKLKTLGEAEFNKQFTDVAVNNGRLIAVQDEKHITMGYDKFKRGLKDVILAYNPNFDTSRAIALAESGIIKLNADEDKINEREKKSSAGSTGTKCQK